MYMVPSNDVASESVLDQLNAITHPSQKAEFLRKNKEEIYSAYQAQINQRLAK